MLKLEGMRFGRLVIVRRVPGGAWLCQCDCGKMSYATTSNLRGGNSKSCGCALQEVRTTHGMSRTPTYIVWKTMHSRCRSMNPATYPNYMGRGISVCAEWSDFTVFLKDMGPKPRPDFDLDRTNNDLGYSKTNCRWVSRQQNLNNRRNNRRLDFDGRSLTISEWAQVTGLNYRTLNNRINRGWSIDRALTEPPS